MFNFEHINLLRLLSKTKGASRTEPYSEDSKKSGMGEQSKIKEERQEIFNAWNSSTWGSKSNSTSSWVSKEEEFGKSQNSIS